jgi:hypothetical protein
MRGNRIHVARMLDKLLPAISWNSDAVTKIKIKLNVFVSYQTRCMFLITLQVPEIKKVQLSEN